MTILKFDQACDTTLLTQEKRTRSRRLKLTRRKEETATNPQLRKQYELLQRQFVKTSNELASVRMALNKSNRDFQTFVNAVSHDLQTPLRAISGFSGFLKEEYENQLDDTADEYINRVVDGASRMDRLINRLVTYSRLTSKATPFETVSLNQVFEHVVQQLHEPIQALGAVVTADDLPDVSGDPAQLAQLFKNLIENSLVFHSDVPTVIHVSASHSPHATTLAVSDNGIGIERAHHESVFTMFRRLQPTSQSERVGAGLAICRRIVEQHAGEIWCESEPGSGSTFLFTLPR